MIPKYPQSESQINTQCLYNFGFSCREKSLRQNENKLDCKISGGENNLWLEKYLNNFLIIPINSFPCCINKESE